MPKKAAPKIRPAYRNKELIVFDLDGTLAPSKSIASKPMIRLILKLLEKKKMAVIGGGKYELFQRQLTAQLPHHDGRLQNLFLFPTTSNAFYRYHGQWRNVYQLKLSRAEKKRIKKEFAAVLKAVHYTPPKKIYGVTLEDRTTQMSFSPLGQDIVTALGNKGIRLKEQWNREHNPLRLKMVKLLARRLPGLEVRAGGLTTIDITRKGIDKAYGVRQIKKTLKIPISRMLFVGDALYKGGNDAAVKKTGVDWMAVKNPKETEQIIRQLV
ncbi:MAG: HAD-IIB family hydrolase [Patescibacteria group bacterium]|nr:HAD-IIB family hydrolase [Patescibacteria group bacterium]